MRKWIGCWIALLLCLGGFTASGAENSAAAACVINGETGEVIFAENADAQLPMASTTKIMTALLLCEAHDFDRQITVTEEMLKVEGSSMGLLPGDRVTYRDLLYGMMLASGNDAANAAAISLAGSVSAFADRMNEKAAALGLTRTHFVTPSGLDADGHVTTAKELAMLASAALSNEEFAKAAAAESAVLCYGNPPYRRTLKNHNRLLSEEGVIGVKTGFTKKAGRCLVSAARRDGKLVIAVTLHDPNDWEDHRRLLEEGFAGITTTEYSPAMATYMLPVIGGGEDALEVRIEPYRVNTVQTEAISTRIDLPKFLYAPVQKGEEIGRISYFLGEKTLATVPIVAGADVAQLPQKASIWRQLKNNIRLILRGVLYEGT